MNHFLNSSDMARIFCHDCKGCSSCCHDMGDSILLDSYDLFMLVSHLNREASDFIGKELFLVVSDGLILPALQMQKETQACGFLSAKGRCLIHSFRPGLCRLFPLGRDFSDAVLRYFIVENGCPIEPKTKIKIEKWLEIPHLKKHEQFLTTWHFLIKSIKKHLLENSEDEAYCKQINLFFLQQFFLQAYEPTVSFYEQFEIRLSKIKQLFHLN